MKKGHRASINVDIYVRNILKLKKKNWKACRKVLMPQLM
jgi:hypothetical protein